MEGNTNLDDGGGGVVETRTRKRGIKKGTGLWDQLDMDWIKSQIPFMHPKTKVHTFRFKKLTFSFEPKNPFIFVLGEL